MRVYSTGVKALDDLFGGYQPTLIEFYGETRSGKTTLAGYVPIWSIYQDTKQRLGEVPDSMKFLVIDGDGGFDFSRLTTILQANSLDADEVMSHIEHWEVTEFDEQHKLITDEKTGLAKKIEEEKWKPLLIVFDPVAAIYRGIILRTDLRFRAATIGTYTGKIDLQISRLRHLGVKYGCPVCISTWPQSPVGPAMRLANVAKVMKEMKVSREEAEKLVPKGSEIPMIGGREVGFLPKIIVRIEIPEEDSPLRKAVLYKHRAKPAGGSCYFKLSDKGIEGTGDG